MGSTPHNSELKIDDPKPQTKAFKLGGRISARTTEHTGFK